MKHPVISLVIVLSSACFTAVGGESSFQRPLSADRPDVTESPFTVEEGRWQIESEVVRWSRDSDSGVRVEGLTIGETTFKYGLSHNMDLQVVVAPFVRSEVRAGGSRQSTDGFGDTAVRLKINLEGNDGGSHGYGVMPFIKFPTASSGLGNDHIEGGVSVPFAMDLPGGWELGLMGEIAILRDESDNDHELATLVSAAVGKEIAPRLGVFFELVNEAASTRASTWATTFYTGITYAVSDDIQLDGGAAFGLTSEAEDAVVFFGFTARW